MDRRALHALHRRILAEHEIAQVADIRTAPTSRRQVHFDTGALAVSLPQRGAAHQLTPFAMVEPDGQITYQSAP